jgi:hypothetical protein
MFCAPGLVFGGSEGVVSRFHVLGSRTRFRRYRGCRVPFSCFALPVSFSCFALPDSFSTVPRVTCPVLMFCAPRLVFACTVGVGSHFHVLCSRTRFDDTEGVASYFNDLRSQTNFRRYRRRQVPFSAVPRASGPVFMFYAPELVFAGTEGVGSRFHVLHSRTRFRQFRGHRVPFACFALPDSFSAVPRA